VTLTPGQVFSRKQITENTKRISDRLANDGYAYANVNAVPELNKEKSEVFFTLFVDPGKRAYIRRINFAGNTITRDEVMRREMRLPEGSLYSAEKIRRSRVRLQRLGHFEDVNIETPAVPGSNDQVDLNVTVKERSTGNLLLGVGYSDADGFLVNANVSQRNLFGTGKEMAVSFDNSRSTTNFNVRYIDPYHTPDGVSQGLQFYSTSFDAAAASAAAYNTKTLGMGMFWALPLSELHSIQYGADIERSRIEPSLDSAQVAQDFVATYGPENHVLKTTVTWSRDSLDNFLFPSSGSILRLKGELAVPGSDLEYYTLVTSAGRFWPITDAVTYKMRGEFSYGNGYGTTEGLPFFKNFYAGGSSTVRGYQSRSLGPRDTKLDDPIGGPKRLLGNMEFLFPMPGESPENRAMRLSLFVDGGMVYAQDEKMDLGQLRFSWGLAFNWFSPVGPLAFSYALPINDKPGDQTEKFQFTLGVPLR
jgi:outer membrane protein insertion porin family